MSGRDVDRYYQDGVEIASDHAYDYLDRVRQRLSVCQATQRRARASAQV